MYKYKLGYHIKTGQLCRIPCDTIPVGTVRIIRYRNKDEGYFRNPYSKDGELNDRYWSIYRWQDLERLSAQENH